MITLQKACKTLEKVTHTHTHTHSLRADDDDDNDVDEIKEEERDEMTTVYSKKIQLSFIINSYF